MLGLWGQLQFYANCCQTSPRLKSATITDVKYLNILTKSLFGFLKKRTPPALPPGVGIYVVGDIHGRADCLEAVFYKIDNDPRRHDFERCVEIYLGDYVDRGPDSARVLSLLIERAEKRTLVTLRGNHEVVMQNALVDPGVISDWQNLGGLETLGSYGVQTTLPLNAQITSDLRLEWLSKFPDSHREFLKNLVNFHQEGDYFFVHAGVRPGVSLSRQSTNDLLWIRDEFRQSSAWHGKMIVHAHTPVEAVEFLPNRINIDTGAYMTGNLTCLCLHGTEQVLL